MIVDILPLPDRGVKAIDTSCVGFRSSAGLIDGETMVWGRYLPLTKTMFKYKILESVALGFTEKIIISFEPLNLNTLLSMKTNKPVILHLVSVKYFLNGNVEFYRLAEPINAIINKLSGHLPLLVTTTNHAVVKIIESAFARELFEIAECGEEILRCEAPIVGGLCEAGDNTGNPGIITDDTINTLFSIWYGWDRNVGSYSDVFEPIIEPIMWTACNNDTIVQNSLNDGIVHSNYIRSCISQSYNGHMFQAQQSEMNPFKDKSELITIIPHDLRGIMYPLINYIDGSIYTDMSVSISSSRDVDIHYVKNRYQSVDDQLVKVLELTTRAIFRKLNKLIKITIVKTWMEELFIELRFSKTNVKCIYIDLVSYGLGTHALVETY